MANEPLRGVAPQAQVPPRPAAQPAPAATVPAATQPVAPAATEPAPAGGEPVKERTQENFEKLLESNNKLFQQQQAQSVLINQLLQQQQRVPQAPAAPAPAPAVAKVDPNDFIEKDPVTGENFINESRLRATLTEIQQRATRAEEMAQNQMKMAQQQERDRQEREAYNSYPELNPNDSKFDPTLNRAARAFLTDSMLNPNEYSGRPLTFKEAADLIRAGAKPTQAQVAVAQQVEAAVEAAQPQAANATPTANQIKKEQAAASVSNQPPQAASEISEEELRVSQIRTRQGDDNALAERLMHTDHIFGPNSSSGQPD